MTVAQLEKHMGVREWREWVMFEEEFGPLTIQERIDAAAGLIAYTVHATAGGKAQLADFIPQWRPQPKVEITEWLSAIAKRDARR